MISLFSFVIIVNIPILFNRYRPFDTISRSSVNRMPFIENLTQIPEWVLQLNIFHVLMVLLLLLMALRIASLRHQEFALEKYQRKVKSVLDYVDMVQFSFLLIALYIVINAFFFSFAKIDGASMQPTLYHNDDVILNHFNVHYNYFDIVVVEVPVVGKDQPDFYIKRLIGFPYDTIRIENGNVYLNNQRLDEPYLLNGTNTYCQNPLLICEFVLEPNEYFLMGDNRENSTDSRNLGPFSKEQLYGVVTYRIRPLNAFGEVN